MDYDDIEPEWKKRGIVPIVIDFGKNREINMDNLKRNRDYDLKKKSAKVMVIGDEEDVPKIMPSPNMAPINSGMWYESEHINPNEAVDNNDFVETEDLVEKNSVISSIRDNFIKQSQPEIELNKDRNCILLLRKKAIAVGTIDEIREAAKTLILENEELRDEDVNVFMRIPLIKLFNLGGTK